MAPPTGRIPVAVSGSLPRPESAALELAKSIYLGTPQLQRETAKAMITLDGGYFAAYFAIMKFLGIENILARSPPPWTVFVAILPPILTIMTIWIFVVVALPIKTDLTLDDAEVARKMFESRILYRYWLTVIGALVFGLALVFSVYVALA